VLWPAASRDTKNPGPSRHRDRGDGAREAEGKGRVDSSHRKRSNPERRKEEGTSEMDYTERGTLLGSQALKTFRGDSDYLPVLVEILENTTRGR